MPFSIIRQDLVKLKVDTIVNAANTELRMGGGVCGAIFKAAGPHELQAACNRLGTIQTGQAVITPGFLLPAKFIIHTAGPVYQDGAHNEGRLLADCYRNSLTLAMENGCTSIAFPLISTGIYGFPKPKALQIAVDTIEDFLSDHDLDVYLVVFDKEALMISQQLLGELTSYIDEHYVSAHSDQLLPNSAQSSLPSLGNAPGKLQSRYIEHAQDLRIDDLIGNLDEPFSATLLRLIDAKGLTDVQVYKRANIDRKLFSKIRTKPAYMPAKRTALAFCIALELSLEETDDLLSRAGYTLSRAQKFDVIVEYFILNHKYNVFEINEVLFQFDQQLLGV